MAETLQSVRGMNDLLPPDSAKWNHFESRCRQVFELYGYGEIRTPVLEPTALFARGIGEATDIVEKEMYTFEDRGGRSLTMRPEMTASCVRAYIQHSMHMKEPITRWYYSGPMFRYERMQTGRYRQFYQIGVEAFGVAAPTLEAEQIGMLYELYTGLGLHELKVCINTVGSGDERPRYRQALVDFVTPFQNALCGDCQRRLQQNPLRLLDCKVQECKAIMADAPSIFDSLSEQSRVHFEGAQAALASLGVPFVVDTRLVRGLDYYTGTVFEILANAETLGTQSTIVAGGRYDGLVESLGGPAVPAVGFALGVERAVLSLPGDGGAWIRRPEVFLVSRGPEAQASAFVLAAELRRRGLYVELDYRESSMKAQFKRADKLQARFVATLGESELRAGSVQLKNMDTRSEESVPRNELAERVLRAVDKV